MSISNVAECFYVVRIASVGLFREVCLCGAMERFLFGTFLPIRNISQHVHAMGCFKNFKTLCVVFGLFLNLSGKSCQWKLSWFSQIDIKTKNLFLSHEAKKMLKLHGCNLKVWQIVSVRWVWNLAMITIDRLMVFRFLRFYWIFSGNSLVGIPNKPIGKLDDILQAWHKQPD